MAKNDKVLIDGIIDDRIETKIPSEKRDEVFEYFTFEQILKDYDLSNDELLIGNVDGRNDGGIDGFYIFVNGHILNDMEKFNWPKSGSILEIWIITCKYHDTFKQAPLDNLAASLTELFDLSIENEQLKCDYSHQIISQRSKFKNAYRKVSPRLSEFSINICYASRGSSEDIGESIKARARQIEQICIDSFGNCNSMFNFYGSTELIDLHRKAPNFSLELPFSDNLTSGETYILLVKLRDYYNFISDDGKLRRYLFDSNVRDFMGLNRVNEDIRNTLSNDKSPDFWWLNNGITILATGASVVGKSIQIEDIQIVNGLQTSESIFRYFDLGGTDIKNRSVLVKVIVSNNSENRDEIIRATNNQTIVELASLHATDKIQRDIEEILKLNDFYYERRTNYYKNQGILPEKILTPLYLASGFVSLILKSPEQGSELKSRFMRNEESYNKVFSLSTDLKVWPKIAFILKSTDKFLVSKKINSNNKSEHFLKNRRHFVSFITISRLLNNFDFTIYDLISFELSRYSLIELEKSWDILHDLNPVSFSRTKLKRHTLLAICKEMSVSDNIEGYERLEHNFGLNYNKSNQRRNTNNNKCEFNDEFIEKVYARLPKQPWQPGIHKIISKDLACSSRDVFKAIDILTEKGRLFKQINGVVYDHNGNILNFDEARVDSNTFKLKE